MVKFVKVNGKTFTILISDTDFESGMAVALGAIPVDVRRDGWTAQPIVPVEDAKDIARLVLNADFQTALAHVWSLCFNAVLRRPFDIEYTIAHTIKSYPAGYNPDNPTEEAEPCPRPTCNDTLNPQTGRCPTCGATPPGMPA